MRYLLLLAVILVLGCSGGVPVSRTPTVQDVSRLSQFSLIDDQGVPYCFAVAISPVLAVTASHCVRQLPVKYETGLAYLVGFSKSYDLALIRLEGVRDVWAPIQLFHQLAIGDVVYNLMGKTSIVGASGLIETSAKTVPGMSGSALLDEYGELIGVCRGYDTVTGNGLYVPASAIAELWKAYP